MAPRCDTPLFLPYTFVLFLVSAFSLGFAAIYLYRDTNCKDCCPFPYLGNDSSPCAEMNCSPQEHVLFTRGLLETEAHLHCFANVNTTALVVFLYSLIGALGSILWAVKIAKRKYPVCGYYFVYGGLTIFGTAQLFFTLLWILFWRPDCDQPCTSSLWTSWCELASCQPSQCLNVVSLQWSCDEEISIGPKDYVFFIFSMVVSLFFVVLGCWKICYAPQETWLHVLLETEEEEMHVYHPINLSGWNQGSTTSIP